jgi:hypothetical protein
MGKKLESYKNILRNLGNLYGEEQPDTLANLSKIAETLEAQENSSKAEDVNKTASKERV